jgi:hypothetical protein
MAADKEMLDSLLKRSITSLPVPTPLTQVSTPGGPSFRFASRIPLAAKTSTSILSISRRRMWQPTFPPREHRAAGSRQLGAE